MCAVTAVPDSRKGERLIVLHKATQIPIPRVIDKLQEAGLPNIWIPTTESFKEVKSLPLLGTVKLDLKAVKDVAMENFGPREKAS